MANLGFVFIFNETLNIVFTIFHGLKKKKILFH